MRRPADRLRGKHRSAERKSPGSVLRRVSRSHSIDFGYTTRCAPQAMPARTKARYAKGDVLVLVGTMKGAFILSSNESRKKWKVDGPHFPGEAVYAVAYDERAGRCRVLA